MERTFDNRLPTGLMIGRFQPWHGGHRALFEKVLEKSGQVCIAIRDTYGTSEKDPLTTNQVIEHINNDLLTDYEGLYRLIVVPNITGVYYGRDVGYAVEQIKLDDKVESISATKIRAELNIK
jgi:nicotinamide mononucleotide adenylyltransferase